MLGLLFYQHFELVFEVKDLQEVILDLLCLIKSLLHTLGINTSVLIFAGHIFGFSELCSDFRDLDLSLTCHLPCILQTGILRPESLLEFTEGFVAVLEKSKLVGCFFKLLFVLHFVRLGGVELILQIGELVLLLQESLIFFFDIGLELSDLLLKLLKFLLVSGSIGGYFWILDRLLINNLYKLHLASNDPSVLNGLLDLHPDHLILFTRPVRSTPEVAI